MSGTIKKIDPESVEFKEELEKTIKFTDKVCAQFGFVYNPDPEINQGIQFGLTRNKLIHGKRYCPCFFVTGNKEEDRICPCKPALEHVPTDGVPLPVFCIRLRLWLKTKRSKRSCTSIRGLRQSAKSC